MKENGAASEIITIWEMWRLMVPPSAYDITTKEGVVIATRPIKRGNRKSEPILYLKPELQAGTSIKLQSECLLGITAQMR